MYLLPISRNETFSPAPKLFVSLFLLPCKDNHCPDFWSNFLNVFTMDISVQFSCSVMSDSLQPHEPQHARPPCTSPTPRVHPNPCPLSRWYHPTIPSSAFPFSFCLQFQHQVFSSKSALCMRWPKYWSLSFSISPSSEYSGLISFRIDWFDLLFIQGRGWSTQWQH